MEYYTEFAKRLEEHPDLSEYSADELADMMHENGLSIGVSNEVEYAIEIADLFGIEADLELVEIANGAWFVVNTIKTKLRKGWIEENDISPQFQVGDWVTFSTRFEKFSGEITKIHLGVAQYLVCCPELGHVKEGMGTHGIYVNFEDAELK